jgi:hypothetical protein
MIVEPGVERVNGALHSIIHHADLCFRAAECGGRVFVSGGAMHFRGFPAVHHEARAALHPGCKRCMYMGTMTACQHGAVSGPAWVATR